MGSSSQNTQQQQQSTTNPWAPSQPELQQLLAGIQGISPAPTAGQNAAVNNLTASSANLPNYGNAAGSVTSGLLGGDPTGLLASGNSNLQKILSPIANASLDPMQTPGIRNILDTIQQDVGNNVNSTFAGAGRDLSGLNQQTLARGISQGEAAPLLGQYNQNVANTINAGSQMFGANYNTAGAMTGNQQAGLGAAQMQPGIAQAPALAQLQAAMTKYNLPLSNLGGLEGLTLPIAGLGGQSVGTGSSSTNYNPSLLAQIGAGAQMFPGVSGAASGIFGGLQKLLQQGVA